MVIRMTCFRCIFAFPIMGKITKQFAKKNDRFSTYSYPNMKTSYLKLLLQLNLSLTKRGNLKCFTELFPSVTLQA